MGDRIEQGHDGLYGVCIFNAENISDDEVQSIFGEFGKVEKVNRSGKLTFVRYDSLAEATNCLESMRNHPTLNVKPAKNKFHSDRPENNRNRFSGDRDMSQRSNSGGDFRGRKGDDYDRKYGGGDNRSNSSTNKVILPKLVPMASLPPTEEKKDRKEAKAVIVGNLPPNMKQSNLYELCSKTGAKPLHIAMKKMRHPPYPTCHYGYVYVKTDQDVSCIANGLHRLKVNGYILVAENVEKLAEEGKAESSKKYSL